MPLPPALAARLSKRGLIKSDEPKHVQKGEEEEVFVEHYDDQPNDIDVPEEEVNEPVQDQEVEEDDILIHEFVNCPNRVNPYHDCVDYCKEKWGTKSFEPNTELDEKRQRMLQKYPLPETWLEVGDPETGRFYYWNTESDKVSWLPPLHPKAQESFPQEKLRELARITQDSDSDSSSSSGSSDHSDIEEEEEQEMDIDDFEEIERRVLKEKREKERRQTDRRRRDDTLDPMDPASYSDIPRGTWSSGLELPGSAKTGVDSTASGPLFQQRPYPSPGAVLRMNKPKD